MEPSKDGSNQHLEERKPGLSSDYLTANNDQPDTRAHSPGRQSDEEFDNEALADDELTEADFEIDGGEEEEEEDDQ